MPARSAASEASQASRTRPASASTRSDDPTFTTMRRKSARSGSFFDIFPARSAVPRACAGAAETGTSPTEGTGLQRLEPGGRGPRHPGMSKVFIGTSGWTYDGWRGPFYPADVPKKDWLRHYGSQFPTTEINGSFYRTPSLKAVRAWREQTPDD